MTRFISRLLMAGLFALQSSLAVAGAQTAAEKKADQEKKTLEENMQKLFDDTALDFMFRQYQLAVTPERFTESTLSPMRPEDRRTFLKVMSKYKVLPQVRKVGRAFVFRVDKKHSVRFEPVNLKKGQVKINGQLWSYLPDKPLVEQLRMLDGNVPDNPRETAGLLRLLLPEAQAEPITITVLAAIAISAVVTAVVTSIINNGVLDPAGRALANGFCSMMPKGAQSWGICVDWAKRTKEEAAKGGAKLDAIEKVIASDKTNVLGKFQVIRENSCPNNSDGKDRIYNADVQLKERENMPVTINAKFSGEGKAKELLVKDLDGKVLSTIEFDEENQHTCARFPNPEAEKDKLTSKNVKLCFGDDLKPEERAKLSFIDDTVKFTNLRVTRCTVQQAAEQVAKGQTVASPVPVPTAPAAPKENATSGQL